MRLSEYRLFYKNIQGTLRDDTAGMQGYEVKKEKDAVRESV